MTNSQKNQNSKLTPAERRVKKTNDHLREELGINIKIDLAGNSLRIRKTLPPRSEPKQTKWQQQTITLGLTADQQGVAQASQDVIHLNALLSQRKFDWKTWDQYLHRPCQHRVKQTELIGTQVKRFKEHLLASEKITQEKTWKSQWSFYFNKLPCREISFF